MLFDTPVYFLFLTCVVWVYWRLSWRKQNAMLLAASYFFYGWWDWRFLGLIIVSTLVDFLCARAIARSVEPVKRRLLLMLSVSTNLIFLGYFKYCDFFIESFVSSAASLGFDISLPLLNVVLPPGISFYTFQALAYIVDVYHHKLKPAESLLDYALFISLFPHLIAGPIQRPSHLLPQVQAPRVFDPHRFFDGLMLITSGLFRKCVVADTCALVADAAFGGRLGEPGLANTMIGVYAFAWQIYGDFSGYSDIARGSAQLMGFHFMVNFRQPYLATSLQDFWRRWHISLSTWLRDYLYIPLGGNRRGDGRTYVNLILTMIIGGFWHGANWTYTIWGAIHGGGLALERLTVRSDGAVQVVGTRRSGTNVWVRRVIVFHLVCFGWLFFRATSVRGAFDMLGNLGRLSWHPEYAVAAILVSACGIVAMALDLLNEGRGEEYVCERLPMYVRVATAWVLLVGVTFFSGSQKSAFLYFQF
jgi:alginate O-acetyltransferase complex protein AlgI